jgi:hypothetical protein
LISETKSEVYTRIRKLGYLFGLQFQTIHKIYNLDNNEYLVEITDSFKGNDEHVCHPITIDSILQAFAVTSIEKFEQLHLPSSIDHFEILLPLRSLELKYAHITPNNIYVYDTKHVLVALVKGMKTLPSNFEHLQTSLEASKGINQIGKTTPIFEESWIPCPTTASYLRALSTLIHNTDKVHVVQHIDNTEMVAFSDGVGKSIQLALSEGLSWNSIVKPGDIINAKKVILDFGLIIAPPALQFVNRLLEILEEDGYLKSTPESSYSVLKVLPTKDILALEIQQCRKESRNLSREWETTDIYLDNLVPILLGKINPLHLLFPSAGSKSSAEAFYTESGKLLNSTWIEFEILI